MWWGVVAALLANLLFSIGFVVEKRALSALPPLSAARPTQVVLHLLRSPLWIVGAGALGLGFVAQLAVYRTLPLIAAQGLFVTGLVMLLLLSSIFLGEESSGGERRSMVLILLALVMIVVSLRGEEEPISRHAPTVPLLLVCVPAILAGLALFATAERRSRRRHRLPTSGVPYGVAVGFLYGVSSLAIKGVAGHLDTGDLGGSALAVLTSPYPYLLLVTGSSGLVLSQTALQRCRASLIVPVCTTVTFLFTVAAGTLVFAEPLPDDPLRLALRLGGSALAVTVLLALPRHETGQDEPGPEAPPGPAAAAAVAPVPPAPAPPDPPRSVGPPPPAGPASPLGAPSSVGLRRSVPRPSVDRPARGPADERPVGRAVDVTRPVRHPHEEGTRHVT
ncbi:hypothetical protein H3146_10170 [Streptomyces sp. OF3]|uniref:Magnesium transporter NIPA n=1 Tax=Streptomyces alkaliterrae TaxID=2213162 RepID=A0A7W3WJY1_9ACTN|nr:hypothetical protein [Streptomyces alkaliterrae]